MLTYQRVQDLKREAKAFPQTRLEQLVMEIDSKILSFIHYDCFYAGKDLVNQSHPDGISDLQVEDDIKKLMVHYRTQGFTVTEYPLENDIAFRIGWSEDET